MSNKNHNLRKFAAAYLKGGKPELLKKIIEIRGVGKNSPAKGTSK